MLEQALPYNFSFVLITDPSVVPNADDTSRALAALELLSRPGQFGPLIEKHERDKHFICFEFERNPSFSANCNVLLGFIHTSNPAIYLPQINKCLRFICDEWWNSDMPLTDKWVNKVLKALSDSIEPVSVLSIAPGDPRYCTNVEII